MKKIRARFGKIRNLISVKLSNLILKTYLVSSTMLLKALKRIEGNQIQALRKPS